MITDHIRGGRFRKRLAQALDGLENLCRRVLRRSGLAPRGAALPATPPATEEIIRARLRKLRVRNNLFAVERALFDLTAALLVAFLIWYVLCGIGGASLFNAYCLTGAVGCFALLSLLRARRGWMRKNGAAALLDAELEFKQRLVTFAEYAGGRVKPLLYEKLAADIVSELSDEKIRKIRRHRAPFSAYVAISIVVALLLNLLLMKIDPGIGYVLAEAGAGPRAGRTVEGAVDGTLATGGAARGSAGAVGSVLGRLVEQLAMGYFPGGLGKRGDGAGGRAGDRAADSSPSPGGSRKGSVAGGGYPSVSTSKRGAGAANQESSGKQGGAQGGAPSSSRDTESDGARGERQSAGAREGEKAGKPSSRKEPGDGGTSGKKDSAGGKGGKGTKAASPRSGTGDDSKTCDKQKGAPSPAGEKAGSGGTSSKKEGLPRGGGSGKKTAVKPGAGTGTGLGTDGDPPRGAGAKGDDNRGGASAPVCDKPVNKDHWDKPGPLVGGGGAGNKPAEKKSDPSAPEAPPTEATEEMHLALKGMKRETARATKRLTLSTGGPAEDSGEVARPSIGVRADARLSKEQADEDAIDSAAIPAEYREIIKRIHLKNKGERKEY